MTDNHSPSSDPTSVSLFSLLDGCSLEQRCADFKAWVVSVRDPAIQRAEGVRRLTAGGGRLVAEYNIAELPDGRWAIRVRCDWRTGDWSGQSSPWTEMPTRQDCLDLFLSIARGHFACEPRQRHLSDTDLRARREMLQRLGDSGLFGFIEPPVNGVSDS